MRLTPFLAMKTGEDTMTKLPIVAILLTATALGVANLMLRFRGRRKPVLIGVHLLTGIGALEVLVYYLKDVNSGNGLPPGAYGNVAAAFLGAATFIGLVSPVIGRKSPQLSNWLLAGHMSCGIIGVTTAIVWVTGL